MYGTHNRFNIYAAAVIFILCTLDQGGFYGGCIVAAGAAAALCCLFAKVRFNVSKALGAAFCAWYFLCAVKDGFTVEYAAKALLPLSVLTFSFLIPTGEDGARTLRSFILKASVFVAALSVISCVWDSISGGALKRALFPFQYSTATGLYFGVTFVMCLGTKDRFLKIARWLFIAALLMTQSVGAIFVTAAAVFIVTKDIRKILISVGVLAVLAFVFRGRIVQSAATFIERLLQMYDGAVCVLREPLFGIGAGRWDFLRYRYQSGFYSAGVIHSGPVQAAVDSGVPGLILLCAWIFPALLRTFKADKRGFVCASMILAHSLFDFSLSFLSVGMLLALLLSRGAPKREKASRPLSFAVFIPVFAVFAAFSVFLYNIRGFEVRSRQGDPAAAVSEYRSGTVLPYSVGATECAVRALCRSGKKSEADRLISENGYLQTDILLIPALLDRESMISLLEQRPYDEALYDLAPPGLGGEARRIRSAAAERASFLGKLLYEMQNKQ